MAVGAAVPMPRFWIWYTGWVGLCPSFSPLGGAGAAGGGGTVPSGVEALAVAAGPFPSSRGFMRTMGFSRGAGVGGAAGAAGGGGCFDYGSEMVAAMEEMLSQLPPLLPKVHPPPSPLTRSAGGLERMMGVFCMTAAFVSSLPSCGERGHSGIGTWPLHMALCTRDHFRHPHVTSLNPPSNPARQVPLCQRKIEAQRG
jgi:hypothetical protein